MSVVGDPEQSLELVLGARSAFDGHFRTQLEAIRKKYPEPDADLDDVLNAHYRAYVVNTLLRALNWRRSLAPETGLEHPLAVGSSIVSGGRRQLLDSLGGELAQCEAPLLVVEMKRPGTKLPVLAPQDATVGVPTVASSDATVRTHSEVIAQALSGALVQGEWRQWLRSVREYVRELDGRNALPARVMLTDGDWVVLFRDPGDSFLETGTRSAHQILVWPSQSALCDRYEEIFEELEYSRVGRNVEPIDASQLLFHVPADQVVRLVHGLRLLYVETEGVFARDAPSPVIKIVPVLFVGTLSGSWLVVRSPETHPLPHGDKELVAHLESVDSAAKQLLSIVTAAIGRKIEPTPISRHYAESFDVLPGVRRLDPRDEYQVVTGSATHYVKRDASVARCLWHDWANAERAGVQTRLPIIRPSTNPRAFFRSTLEQHCAHREVGAAKAARVTVNNKQACGRRSAGEGGVFCEIAPFETHLCCRTCAFEDVCTAAPVFVLPCSRATTGMQALGNSSAQATTEQRRVIDAAMALISERHSYFVNGPALRLKLQARNRPEADSMIASCVPRFLARTESSSETYCLTLEGLLEGSDAGPSRILDSALKAVREGYADLVMGGGRMSWRDIVKRGAEPKDLAFADVVFYACQLAESGHELSDDTLFIVRWSPAVLESVIELEPGVAPFREWFRTFHPPEKALAPLAATTQNVPPQRRSLMLHVRLEVEGEKEPEFAWDLDEASVRDDFVGRWEQGATLLIDGRKVAAEKVRRLQVFESAGTCEDLEREWNKKLDSLARDGIFVMKNSGEQWIGGAKEVTRRFLSPPAQAPAIKIKAGSDDVRCDAVVITARKDEYDETVKVDDGALDEWQTRQIAGKDVVLRTYKGRDKPVRIALTWATKMRTTAAGDAAGRLVDEVDARLLAMSGVCAGRRGKVAPGDVVIATLVYTYDTGATTVEEDESGNRTSRFQAEPDPYPLSEQLHRAAEAYRTEASDAFKDAQWLAQRPPTLEAQSDWLMQQLRLETSPLDHPESAARCPSWKATLERLKKLGFVEIGATLKLTEVGRTHIDEKLMLHRNQLPPPPPWRVHAAPMATGNNVMRDPQLFDRLSNSMRDVLGVDMEASAIGAIAHARPLPWVVMKGVMDHADNDKDDELKPFAARAAAECLFRFVRTKAF